MVAIDDTELSTWFERDRAHVCLSRRGGDTIVEWWDEAVASALEDGFLTRGDLHGSAYAYARDNGLLEPGTAPLKIEPERTGWIGYVPDLGVYCGWRGDGSPIWSSEADAAAARGAYAFDSEEEGRELFEGDGTEGGEFALAVLDIRDGRVRDPNRASFAACEAAGAPVAAQAAMGMSA